jgi:hypothetical protein
MMVEGQRFSGPPPCLKLGTTSRGVGLRAPEPGRLVTWACNRRHLPLWRLRRTTSSERIQLRGARDLLNVQRTTPLGPRRLQLVICLGALEVDYRKRDVVADDGSAGRGPSQPHGSSNLTPNQVDDQGQCTFCPSSAASDPSRHRCGADDDLAAAGGPVFGPGAAIDSAGAVAARVVSQ